MTNKRLNLSGFLCGFLLLPLLAQSPSDEIIRKAMKDELDRNMKQLIFKDYKPPFFISYTIEDIRNLTSTATLGALVSSDEHHYRNWSTRVMVGDYKTTDENFVSANRNKPHGDGNIELPLDDDYLGIRRSLWLAANNVYKSAADNYKNKIESLRDKNLTQNDLQIDDFSHAPVTKLISPSKPVKWDLNYLNNISRELSSVFKNYTEIQYSGVTAFQVHAVMYFVNSEGSETQIPFDMTLLTVIAFAQSDDGEMLNDQAQYCVTDPDHLPAIPQIKTDIAAMADNLLLKRTATPLDEDYNGPALIVGQSVASVFAQTLFSGKSSLIAYREPLYNTSQMSMFYGNNENSFESKIDKPVATKNITIKSIPKMKQYNGLSLVGCFDFDAEGVVPADELLLIENGVLKTLLNGRTPSRKINESNGHNRYVLYDGGITEDVAPGVIDISVTNGKPYEKLKEELLKDASDEGFSYALIIKPLKINSYNMPENIYRVSVADGSEELLRSYTVKPISENSLKKISSVSDKTMVHNFVLEDNSENQEVATSLMPYSSMTIPSGAPVSFIMPDAILLPEIEINKETRPIASEKPVVNNPIEK
jgi:hypothetical protein